ncbi:protocadherin-18 [Protopterus annectens]|uniref:protocadherin-18 n=1 Tax=Protopterus annectens TaxID=7888 RepID=UPI001CFBF344|nr:protocadherin-18 [Protopterus annectens]
MCCVLRLPPVHRFQMRSSWQFFSHLVAMVVMVLMSREAQGTTVRYRVYEEQKVGTVIGRLSEDVADRLPQDVVIMFRTMQKGNTTPLAVKEDSTGEITVQKRLDREQLCPKDPNCTIEFEVITLPTSLLQLFHVVVEVLDINDNAPHFSRSVIPIEISESAAVGTRLPLDGAFDPDVGENGLHDYSLAANDAFKVEVLSQNDGTKYAKLVVVRELDRERQASYELLFIASDRGIPPRSGSALLRITVLDSNDNSPVFERQSYALRLPENAPVGSLLIDLNATDPDEGANGKVVYSFSSHVSPRITETFKIDPESGHLTLIKQVDYESTKSYEIDVQAQDMGPNSIPTHCKITINVLDVNDNKPEININLMSPGKDEVAYISEGVPPDTFVALVRVQDKDSGLNGEVVCKLHGHGHFRLQKTHENNYIILTNASLDREKRSEYSLTVIAEDKGIPGLSTAKHFTVQVADENDNAPHFQKSRYEIFLSENNFPGKYITSVMATDPDLEENGQVTYTILENYVIGSSITTYVTIDPSNGAIYALRSFDHEDVNKIIFVVQARDGGTHQLISNATVVLTIIDENDNAPVILVPALRNGTANISVPKDADYGYLVSTIRASDRDSGINAELSCSIVSGNEDRLFTIDSRKCDIYTNASLETVHFSGRDLLVMVQDKGSPQLSSTALLKLGLFENVPDMLSPAPTTRIQSSLDVSMIIIISLGAICAVLLVIMVVFAARCNREKKDTRSYNCRVAESTYQHHPKRPSRQIHKGDITLVPTMNGTLPIRSHHRSSPSASPTLERGQMSSRQSQHSRQSLNSLATISSNHVPESFSLELTHTTPPVEVSQLLSMLHQGQYQPRPSFRGNKYSRSYRYALQDMDKFSLKDSGRGDSEAGDSDYDLGRDSPIDRLLGEGYGDLYLSEGHRLPVAMRLCTDECRVLGHSDQCWMPPLPSPSSDYRSNMFVPGEDGQQHQQEQQQQQQQQQQQPQPPDEECQPAETIERKKSFSTFGKESQDEENSDLSTTSLLSEMNSVFQRLLPPSIDTFTECNETERMNSLERRKGQVVAKPPAYPSGVAAWAASTHFQNPGTNAGPPGGTHLSAQPSSKWLPAMEEIPENYEEDEFDNVLSQLSVSRSDSKHELMDASELVAEINKLLQDVRQS